MKRQELERLIKVREAELDDLQQELEQVSALEEVLASKPLTNKEEVDRRIRAKIIDLLLDNFQLTPLSNKDEETITEDVVVLDDEGDEKVREKLLDAGEENIKARLREEAKAEVEAEASLQVLVDGQTLDDLEVEEDEGDDGIPSGEATRSLRGRTPQVTGPQTPQQGLPPASFYQGAQEGTFDADSIPPEFQDRVRAKRTDDGSTQGAVRRKS